MRSPPPGVPPPAPPAAARPGVRRRRRRSTVQRASVWFGQKVALTELSCSFGPGVTGLLGPNGAGQDHAHAGPDRAAAAQRGHASQVLGGDPHRDREVQRSVVARARGRGGPAGAHRPPARALHGRAPRRAPTATMPDRCLGTVGLLDVADRKVGGFSKGMRQRAKVAAALVTAPAGARARRAAQRRRPGAAGRPDRAVPGARRPGADGDRQLARPQRGRAAGLAARSWSSGAGWRPPATTTPSATPWPTGPRSVQRAHPRAAARSPRGSSRLDVVRGRHGRRHDRRRLVAERRRAGRGCCRWRPARSAPACSRCGRSTTRSRACSGSCCGEPAHAPPTAPAPRPPCRRPTAACPAPVRRRSSATRCGPACPPGAGAAWSCRASVRCCSRGSARWPTRPHERVVRRRGGTGPVRPRACR